MTQTGAGPGNSYLSGLLIFVLAAYLVAVTGAALYTVIELWPHSTPAGEPPAGTPKPLETGKVAPEIVPIFGCTITLWPEKRLLLLVLLGGAIGALLHSIRYLSWFVGSRTFRSSWTAYYYLSPLSGAATAFVAYIAIRGGFFSSTSQPGDSNPFMFVALAAVAGLFSREVLEKLKKIAESAFEPAPKTTDSNASAKPAIASLDPASVKVNFTGEVKVNGSGFTKESKVQAGATAMATTFVNDKQLTFVLPASMTANVGKVDVAVKTGSATSAMKQLEVTT